MPHPSSSLEYNSPQTSPRYPLPLERPAPRQPPPLIVDLVLYRLLPLCFFITLLTTLTIILGITFYLKRPLPPHFILSTTIVLVLLVLLGLIGWSWRYMKYQVTGRDSAQDGYELYRYLEMKERMSGEGKQKPSRNFRRYSPDFLSDPPRIATGQGHGGSEGSRGSGSGSSGNRLSDPPRVTQPISRCGNQGVGDSPGGEQRTRDSLNNREAATRGRPDIPLEASHTQWGAAGGIGSGLSANGEAGPGLSGYNTQPATRTSITRPLHTYEPYNPHPQPSLQTYSPRIPYPRSSSVHDWVAPPPQPSFMRPRTPVQGPSSLIPPPLVVNGIRGGGGGERLGSEGVGGGRTLRGEYVMSGGGGRGNEAGGIV
ncbi:hypothetical protein FGG08_003882 [Glutinoglossum americanum]|uniref:Uncharacterized protein n=1 Tax=Glutinoglossum americanum TaxID=1670608 RepID=A0A9P8IA79_9PEZI|nr:hypothetical protein FGG08_003882 [Glutinoglossum americanum]